MEKIITINQLPNLIKQLKLDGKKIVLVGGVFDLLHIGHIRFLYEAKKQGDSVLVLLESDETVRITKGINRPFHKQRERAEMLANLITVDYILLLPFFTADNQYARLIEQIKPAIIVLTQHDSYTKQKTQQAHEVNAKLHVVPKIQTYSTTQIARLLELEK